MAAKGGQPSARPAVSETELLDAEMQKLTAAERTEIEQLKKEWTGGKAESLVLLAGRLDSLKSYILAATYYQELAEKENSEKSWLLAGNTFLKGARNSSDSALTMLGVEKAAGAFEKALAQNSGSLEARNSLALCLAQQGTDVMRAVQLLKDVLKQDSNNVQATFTLGMLSVQSGQYDKAVQRFEKLKALQPFNVEYYYYLADIYNRMGDKQKAIRELEIGRSLLKDEQEKKSIDELIKDIKNN